MAKVNAAIFHMFFSQIVRDFWIKVSLPVYEIFKILGKSGKFAKCFNRWGLLTTVERIYFKLYPSLHFRQGNQPAHLGFKGLSIFLILIKKILNWLYENKNVKKSDLGNIPKIGAKVARDFCPKISKFCLNFKNYYFFGIYAFC